MSASPSLESILIDNHGRPLEYVRLSVTDRCNLRCFYCMPATGVKYVPRSETLSYEEMLRLLGILSRLGVKKVRITGGEPFVRKELMVFLERIKEQTGIQEISITTNGVLTAPYIQDLKAMGISSINLSLDTMDRTRFKEITRRDELPAVLKTLEGLMAHEIQTKINMVVMEGKNDQDIIPMAKLAEDLPISVRYIEEMPFNGGQKSSEPLVWNSRRIYSELEKSLPALYQKPFGPGNTAQEYGVEGYTGQLGIIAAYSRSFCSTCNRIRISATGKLKTCLYGQDVLNLKELLAGQCQDDLIITELHKAYRSRAKDGFEAENDNQLQSGLTTSMSAIGG